VRVYGVLNCRSFLLVGAGKIFINFFAKENQLPFLGQ
jgi:hypothetical protein